MSEAIHFDTHKFVKRMIETGMSEATAEALADEQSRLIQGELTTKTDLQQTEAKLRLEIEKVKSDIVRWMAGLLIAQGGVIVAMLRLLPA